MVAGFNNCTFDDEELEKLKIGLRFLDDFEEDIYEPFVYLRASMNFVRANSKLFAQEDTAKLEELADDCEEILADLTILLEY